LYVYNLYLIKEFAFFSEYYIRLGKDKKMVIDKIDNINNIVDPKRTKSVSKNSELKKTDSLEISSEGKQAAKIAEYTQIVKDVPDIRVDKVNAIKEQIENGTYDKFTDEKVLKMVADKIAANLLRK
jgi:negative regulator of flagellin synthesis FlgM